MDSRGIFVVVATLLVISITFCLSLFVGSRSKKSDSDWNIGGRSLPLFVIIGTQFASAMGGGMIVGQVGNAYNYGIASLCYGFFASVVFLAFIYIGKFIRSSEFETIPDMVGSFCGQNKAIKIMASALTIIVPFGWLISQMVAFAKVYTQITGIPLNVLIVLMALLSLLFVMPAGMKTVAWTDFFFSVLMGTVLIIVIFFAVAKGGTFSNIAQAMPPETVKFPGGLVNVGWATIVTWFIACLPGGMTNQMYFQRVCALDDVKKVNKSLIISAACLFAGFSWTTYMGCAIHAINPTLEGENATGWFMTIMPIALIALFAALITSTIMSTISSAVQSVVVNLTHDIYKSVKPETSAGTLLKMSRVLSVVVLALAVILGIATPEVLNWLVNTYAYSAAGLFVPMYLGYAMRNKNFLTPVGIGTSMVAGILGCVIAQISGSSIPFVVWGICASIITLFAVCAATKNKYYAGKQA